VSFDEAVMQSETVIGVPTGTTAQGAGSSCPAELRRGSTGTHGIGGLDASSVGTKLEASPGGAPLGTGGEGEGEGEGGGITTKGSHGHHDLRVRRSSDAGFEAGGTPM